MVTSSPFVLKLLIPPVDNDCTRNCPQLGNLQLTTLSGCQYVMNPSLVHPTSQGENLDLSDRNRHKPSQRATNYFSSCFQFLREVRRLNSS